MSKPIPSFSPEAVEARKIAIEARDRREAEAQQKESKLDSKLKLTGEQRLEIARQIGARIIASISGGRIRAIENGIELPVSNGYSVRVELTAADDYVVSRIFRRGGKEWVKGSAERVYCDQVSELAYYAGMFRSYDENEWPRAG